MKKNRRFGFTDMLLLAGIILPVVVSILLKVMFIPASEGIQITGAYIFFTIPMPMGGLPITEVQVNSWLVMVSVLFLCLFLTRGLKEKAETKRQIIAEWIVEKCDNLVEVNMGEFFSGFAPFIAAVLGLSVFSSLMSLFGLFPPTSDINTTAGWAILVFILITHYKLKCGPVHYLKSFGQPAVLLTPLNVISEFATPLSMAFRHYGNVLSGSVVSVLVAAGLQAVSVAVFGNLPGILGKIPFFRIGLPAVLSVYFDLFSGCLQAFIFAMLTMLYVAGAFPADDYKARKQRRIEKMKKIKNN